MKKFFNKKDFKVVILAGGLGTRISEYTKEIPKPMVKILNKPLIIYIMKHYAKFGFKDFYIAAGYKQEVLKKFFRKKFYDWNVKIIDTGQKTMTGGRIKRLKSILNNKPFFLTYGTAHQMQIQKIIKFLTTTMGMQLSQLSLQQDLDQLNYPKQVF